METGRCIFLHKPQNKASGSPLWLQNSPGENSPWLLFIAKKIIIMHIKGPAFNYDKFGQKYSGYRRTEPAIAAYIQTALGQARSIINVGAGSGSYEPEDKYVVAVEPSAVMRAQRLAMGKTPALIGKADALPFDDGSFDAAMAMVTIHHWPDMAKGLREMRRVTKGPVLIMTFDPESLDNFWMADYAPELIAVEKQRYPKIGFVTEALGGKAEVIPVPVPFNCIDGFQEAFFGRPEAFLEKEVRMAQSAWGFLSAEEEEAIVDKLAYDLQSGAWDQKYGHYRQQAEITCALRLIVCYP
jgi:SAM-dependent methyltransferase